ncbi:small, acid-soluble spore protein, alpha/beta type [Geosporobacter ferrireducens]|uniref:Uncharacterized protein n=1 Tax=Geosporobacter ferrireducens TaxID=1424294 RepID=A0A1D8GFQ0_9FIRM|nr:small, acid-soluble spore protein, alpha/beta type [Geosporobacter ferrireducens]AOT69726.1 hypothetical protein Gferi_09105 [Geosporobacter ferrireducens]MTI54565.1 small, acid-soluble spore protein, alpha/beta type [Geosporobacter ferrireducens]
MINQGAATEARIAMNQFREEIAGELSAMTDLNLGTTTPRRVGLAGGQVDDTMNDTLMQNASNGMVSTNELPQDLD